MKTILKWVWTALRHPVQVYRHLFFDSYGITGWGLILHMMIGGLALVGGIAFAVHSSRDYGMAHVPPGIEILVRPDGNWTGLYRFRDDAGVNCYSAPEGLSCVRAP